MIRYLRKTSRPAARLALQPADLLADMAELARQSGVAPDAQAGGARLVAEHVILADDLVARHIQAEMEVGLGQALEPGHADQQAAGRDARHLDQAGRRIGRLRL